MQRAPFDLAAAVLALVFAVAIRPAAADDWPQWRGPSRSGLAASEAPVPSTLSENLKPVWKIQIGDGIAGPVVAAGKLAYLDAQDGQETAHVLDAATGQEIWRKPYAAAFGDEWGTGPRATPYLDEGRLYVQACNGEFRCLAMEDGRTIWATNFAQFGAKFLGSAAREGTASRRGNNGAGVIDGARLILPVGSTDGASLVAFEKTSGKVLWRSGHDEAAYAALMTATLAGVRQVVAFTAEALLGADLDTGRILWRVPLKTTAKRHAATPVIHGDTVTVNSHTFGTICFQVTRSGTEFKAAERWANRTLKVNLASYVRLDEALFGFGAGRDFVCVDANTGVLRWSQTGLGRGPKDCAFTIAVGGRLLVLTEAGMLLLLEANPQRYVELGRAQVCGDTWSHPAYAGGRVFVRDRRSLQCLEVTGGGAGPSAK